MVAGLAYRERIARLPSESMVSLVPEPDNRSNPCAVAVHGPDGKIGYLPPEIARHQYDRVAEADGRGRPITCRARRRTGTAGRSTGVEMLLDV